MLALPGEARIFLCTEPVDLRKGFEGLSALAETLFPDTLFTGAYFGFLNKSGHSIKVLYWDGDGFVIWMKRLEKGTFSKKSTRKIMTRRDFFLLLEGVIPKKISKRFCRKNTGNSLEK